MLTYLKDWFILLARNSQMTFLIFLIVLLSSFRFIDNRIIKLMIFCMECALIVVIYVNILTNSTQADSSVNVRAALRYLPRYAWLFVYFIVAFVGGLILLKKLLENIQVISSNKEFLFFGYFTITVVFLSPFYLYSPAFIVLKNCFVYESICEGYRFIKSKPFERIAPTLLILLFGFLSGRVSEEYYIVYFLKNLTFYLMFFCSVYVAARMFKESGISYVSMKTKIENGEWPKK